MSPTKFLFLLLPVFAFSQEQMRKIPEKPTYPVLQFGVRTTESLFSHDGNVGKGVGGQFRIRFAPKINTEWFADYITTDIDGLARRDVAHIGWSVMFYPFKGETTKGNFTPYFLAGHCFDYTRVQINGTGETMKRWSSAVQGGVGTHYNFTDNFDVSLSTQYMMHLGDDIHAEVADHGDGKHVHIHKENLGIEGHLLVTLSLNVALPDLRKNKNK